jgi:hypothetical protein
MSSFGFRQVKWLCVLLVVMLLAEGAWAAPSPARALDRSDAPPGRGTRLAGGAPATAGGLRTPPLSRKSSRPQVITYGGRPRHAAAGGAFQSVLSGRVVPLSMKLKDFDRSWRRFVAGGAETDTMAQLYGPMMGGATAVYTKGDTVVLAGETFLIAYRPQVKGQGIYAMITGRRRTEEEEGVSGETTASLCLLNVRNLTGMTDIRPFDLQAEIAEFEQMSEAMQAMESATAAAAASETDTGNLRELATALQMYIADNDAVPDMSDAESLREALGAYVADEGVFNDSDTGEPYGVNTSIGGEPVAEMKNPAGTVAFYQTQPGEDGKRGVAFFNGRAARVTEERWEKLKAASGIP